VGYLGRGLRILRETIGRAAAHPVAYSRMTYLTGASILLERVARGGERVTLALPAAWGGEEKARDHDAGELSADFARRAMELAMQFDARNGNASISAVIEEWGRFRGVDMPGPRDEDEDGSDDPKEQQP